MNLSRLCIKRPVATIMLMLAVVVLGISSMIGIPQDLFPEIEYPVAMVMTTYSNSGPEEVETMVTEPIEQALASVENLDQIISMSMQGTSIVMVQFQMDTDMNFATLNMREKIALTSSFLPEGAGDPMVLKMDMNAMPIVQAYVSGDMPLSEMNDMVEDNVISYFERVEGVATVEVYGAVEEEVLVELNQEKLSGYGISLAQISQMLAAENINMPSGDVNKGHAKVIVRTMGEFQSVNDIANLPLTLTDRSIVRLGDIATITQGYEEQESISRIDGKVSLGIMITKSSDGNTVEVSDDVIKVINDVQQKFPELNFVVGFNQADFIKQSISSVAENAIMGALLAVVVVFLFLRNIRTTLVIAMSIPISLLATFVVMNFRGMTLNMITLCSLTLAVGMLVDNSIVILENIFRIRQKSLSAPEAAERGATEVFLAVAASTLTTVVVFLPIALSGGITGLMFSDFCLTIVIALLASLIVSVTVVPMLSSKLLSGSLSTEYIRIGSHRYKFRYIQKFGEGIERLKEAYGAIMSKYLKKRKRVILACILIFVISISLVAALGMELLPTSDEGSFSITIDMPYGTSLEDKDKKITEIETYILALPELEHCTVNVGSDSSSLSVTLVDKDERKRSTADIVRQVKKDFSQMTGADLTITESSDMTAMMGGGVDMSLTIKGKELESLEELGYDLCKEIEEVNGVASAEVDISEGNPEIKVSLDRSTAAYYGVTAYQLANGLSSALSGTTATQLKVNGDEIDINLSLPDTYNQSVENMKQILITGSTGQQVPAGQIAEFESDNSPSSVNRINQQRYIVVNVDIDGDLGSVSQEISKLINSYQFPDGYFYESGGQQDEMLEAFGSLLKALIVAIALVYLLLAAQFESITLPFMVMMSVPFAMSGAFLALFITGTKLSMVSFLGLIVLVGIVVNNAILLVEFIKQNKLIMGRDEALIAAGQTRMRPIFMTTATTCIGMVPMALGLGEGGEVLAPMAISIIGGLIASTLVTLFLVPVLYSIFDDRKMRKDEKHRLKGERVSALEEQWKKEDLHIEQ